MHAVSRHTPLLSRLPAAKLPPWLPGAADTAGVRQLRDMGHCWHTGPQGAMQLIPPGRQPLSPLDVFRGIFSATPERASRSWLLSACLASCLDTPQDLKGVQSLLTAFPLSRAPITDTGGSNHKTRSLALQ